MTVELVRFDRNCDLLSSLVTCYRQVFAGEPWNEWKRCSLCGQKFGWGARRELKGQKYIHCGQKLIDFWPRQKIAEDIQNETSAQASFWLAVIGRRVVGFCWGYRISIEVLSQKLKLACLEASFKQNFKYSGDVGYLDDMGLLEKYRGRGWAGKMHDLMLRDFRGWQLPAILARTKTIPPTIVYKWFPAIGYQTVAEYNDSDGRVILAKEI